MKNLILALLIFIPTPFLTSCIIGSGEPGYTSSAGFNKSYISSTGYGVSDYGLGFGTDYDPHYGIGNFGANR